MLAGVSCWQTGAVFGHIRSMPSRPADYLDRQGCKRGYRRIIAGLATAIMLMAGALLAAPAFALDPSKAFSQYVQSSWGLQNGLQQKSVMAVTQTRDGFLWLATEEGLVRFSGRAFVTFDERNAPGLGDRFIRSLAAAPDGSLWIGTMSGLARYNGGKFESFRRQPETRMDIYDLCVGTDGSVWFSSDRGLRRLQNGMLRNYTTADGLPANGITGVAAAPDGTIWVATVKGLVSFQSGRFTTYSKWDGVESGPLNSVSIGRNGAVWVGGKNGSVGLWSKGKITTWWKGNGAGIDSLREDADGTLWIAFEKLGLGRMRGHTLELLTHSNGLPSDNPDWVFEDRERNLWVGWADAGLSMFRDARFTGFGKEEGLSSDSISSVIQAADGSFWVGTADAGVNHLVNGHVRSYSTADGLADKSALGLVQSRDGSVWIGSGSGRVTRINNGKTRDGRATTFSISGLLTPELPAMVQDRDGEMWFGFDMPDGLARFRDGHFEHVPLEGRVKALAVAPDGGLWIASYLYGLSELKNGVFRHYAVKEGLSSTFLTSVYVDPAGVVWAGTALAGLNRLKDGKITHYSVEQGLSDSTVGAVIEDGNGYLWLSGPRGISRVSLQDLNDYAEGRIKAVRSESYGYADGLRSIECNSKAQPGIWKARDGHLWFATTAGLAIIDPLHILTNEALPIVQIGEVSLDGKRAVEVKNGMQMGPGSGRVEINFNAPSFVAPERMQVRYRLIGVDRDWIDVGLRRSATYSNLDPGKYRFEVRAANSDGRGNTDATALDFEILPHYYQTYWFRGLGALCLGLLVWGIYLSRVRYLVRKTQELETTVSQRTAELRAALQVAETAKEQLRDQAMRDSLTGFWNRRAIFEILNGEIARCQKESQPLCVLMADLDHFKLVNDTWGHLAGDAVLREVSDRLRQGLRRFEAVGKYGGEEFLILLPLCPFAVALRRAEELRVAIQAGTIPISGQEIAVTCSFGVAEYEPGFSVEELIGKADAALYAAKNSGRNCVWPGQSYDSQPVLKQVSAPAPDVH
jgi:diguanylate cyclase (GGDEF)-like protein